MVTSERKKGRVDNTVRNIGAGLISKVVSQILPFVSRTIIIYKIGSEYAGLGSLFASILQVLSVTELGFSSAIIFKLYRPIADDNTEEVREWLTIYKIVYRVMGIIILCAGIIVMPFLQYLIKDDVPADINLYSLFAIYLFNTVLSYFLFSYKSCVLVVNQRRDILSNIETFISLGRSLVQILFLLLFKDYYLYIIWLPVFTVVNNVLINYYSKKRYPLQVANAKFKREKFRETLEPLKGVAIGRVALVARNAFDSIVLSMILGLVAVTIYSNYYYIFSFVGSMLSAILMAVSASVGNSLATEGKEKNYDDLVKFDFLFMWLVSWCTVCLYCMYQVAMKLWVGEKLMASNTTMVLFCTYFFVNRLAEVRGLYSEAAGLWWKFRYITIIEMISNIVLNFILGYYFGMNGILWATIITAFFSSFIGITFVSFKYLFNRSPIKYYLYNICYGAMTILVAVVTNYLCGLLVWGLSTIGELIVRMIICAIFPNVLFAGVYFFVPRFRQAFLWAFSIIRTRFGK